MGRTVFLPKCGCHARPVAIVGMGIFVHSHLVYTLRDKDGCLNRDFSVSYCVVHRIMGAPNPRFLSPPVRLLVLFL